tara:strand:- start:254 stop:472 length:219 start_codon:yes stop_codon:yes gene_type:complete
MSKFTTDQLDEFRRLVELGESHQQMDRIESRLAMPKFIEKVGKDTCDEMYQVLLEELEDQDHDPFEDTDYER